MLYINNDFLGYHPSLNKVFFSGSDTEELYQKNLMLQSKDWYYRTNEISYVRNTNGHRCKDIEDIDLDNYILFTGCSHTEGIGLKLEDTYPYLLSKKLNCDYYNLAVGGTGVDTLSYNITTWFAKIKKQPKLLVIQWPHLLRVLGKNLGHSKNDYRSKHLVTHGMWEKRADIFFSEGEYLGIFNQAKVLAKKIVNNITDCPVISLNALYGELDEGDLHIIQVDTARDININGIGHLGRSSNLINTELIYDKIKEMGLKI